MDQKIISKLLLRRKCRNFVFLDGGKRLRPRRQPKKIPLPAGRGEDKNGRSVFTFFDLFSANLGYIKNLAGELLFISRNGENKFNVRNGGNSFEESR